MNVYIQELFDRYPRLASCRADLEAAFDLLCTCYARDGVVYICGNGGSAADAQHIVGELMKSFTAHRPISATLRARLKDEHLADRLQGALRAFPLNGADSLVSAFANDVEPELVFAQQVAGYGRPGDILWAISTSGNSINVVHALKVARAKDMPSLGLTGQDGGKMAGLCDVCICVPETETYKAQELHLPVYHALTRMLEAHFFPS